MCTRHKTINRRRILSISILIIALLIVTAWLFRLQIQSMLGNYLVVEDELYPSDAIHVIAGDDYRTDYAIQLYKQGYAKYIFFTGGWCKYHNWFHGLHGQQRAINQGVPADAIVYDDTPVTSTYDETVLLKTWINHYPTPIHSVIVVSDPFHMRRARWTTRYLLGNGIDVLMAPVPFEQTPYKQQWWTDELSTSYVREEYIKSVYYFLRYQLSLEWLAALDKN
jgi:uncharacterized SAM-binding protein YcdF (DUF218 family)